MVNAFVLSTNNTMVSLWSMPCFINQQHNGFFMINALFYELTAQWFLYVNALFYEPTAQWFLYDQCFVLYNSNNTSQQHNGFFMVNALFYELTTQWFLYDNGFFMVNQWFLYDQFVLCTMVSLWSTAQWFLYGQCFVLSTNNTMVSL